MNLTISDLSFGYNGHPIIQALSFSVMAGEILTILGPNGVGKTTLLKCLGHILKPGSGSIRLDGQELSQLSRLRLAQRIAYLPQRAETSRMRVYDLILLGRKPHFRWTPRKLDHLIIAELIESLGLEELALRWTNELSGGEFQLVQIARALAQEPGLILLDEPSSGLDIQLQYSLMGKIRDLVQQKPRSVVMAMHDINLALRYSDNFLLLKAGRIHALGAREIINPKNLKAVFNLDAQLVEVAGRPFVIPLSP